MTDLNQYDFVIYGATGFTGKLVVEYAIDQYDNKSDISWAIAGRNSEKLEKLNISLHTIICIEDYYETFKRTIKAIS